jgi:hypothetical protein
LKTKVYFTFLQTFFLHYISHECFTCIFIYHIFIFKKIGPFSIFIRECFVEMEKKNQIYV